MIRRLVRFTFEREAGWMLWVGAVIPLIGLLVAAIVPQVIRWASS